MEKDKTNSCCSEEETCSCGANHHDDCGCEHDDCGCGCGCEDEKFVVDLEDENGKTVACEMVDSFQYKDKDYILVQNPEDGSVYLFRVDGNDDEAELQVPEDEEFDEVSAYYETLTAEEE